jgi:KDO2-lipid IV(A) lauroyltransferase
MNLLLKLISLLPLAFIHKVGSFGGALAFRCGSRFRKLLIENMKGAGLDAERLAPTVARQLGMGAVEMLWIWKTPSSRILELVQSDEEGLKRVHAVLSAGRNAIFMTPHVGCFEISPIWGYEACLKKYGKQIVILFRMPKMKFLQDFVARSREREGIITAPADLSGVRRIIRLMRDGQVFGSLPDQAPGRGEGVWAPFFGRLAYTMTFPLKMAREFDAARFVVWTERIPGKGWKVFIREWTGELTGDQFKDAAAMNRMLEQLIMKAPEQYIWNYNRYKSPRGAHEPTDEEKALLDAARKAPEEKLL